MDTAKFVHDRDSAFIDFVETGNTAKVRKYCRKYGVQMPKDKKVFAAGIYKAVQQCTDIPQEIKDKAFIKCLELGFSPSIGAGFTKGKGQPKPKIIKTGEANDRNQNHD